MDDQVRKAEKCLLVHGKSKGSSVVELPLLAGCELRNQHFSLITRSHDVSPHWRQTNESHNQKIGAFSQMSSWSTMSVAEFGTEWFAGASPKAQGTFCGVRWFSNACHTSWLTRTSCADHIFVPERGHVGVLAIRDLAHAGGPAELLAGSNFASVEKDFLKFGLSRDDVGWLQSGVVVQISHRGGEGPLHERNGKSHVGRAELPSMHLLTQ